MPTAAKLVAALLFAGLAWAASDLAERRFPAGTDLGWFAEVNAAVGAVMGWQLAPARGRATLAAAAGHGLTAAAATALVALGIHGVVLMLRQSLRRLYDGPVEALAGAVEIALRDGRVAASPAVVGTLVAGGVVAGLLTEWAGRRLP